MRHKASFTHFSGATKANPGFLQLPTPSQPGAKQENKHFISKDPVRCFSKLASKQQIPLWMAKKAKQFSETRTFSNSSLVSQSLDHKLSSQAAKTGGFYPPGAWQISSDTSISTQNVKNAAGGAGTAAGAEGEGSHSGVDTWSTTLDAAGWLQTLQERQNIPSPAVWEGSRVWVAQSVCWRHLARFALPHSTFLWLAQLAQPLHFPSACSQTQILTASPPWDTTTAVRTLAQWRTGCPENQQWNYLTSGLGSSWTNDLHVALGHSTCEASLTQALSTFISHLN